MSHKFSVIVNGIKIDYLPDFNCSLDAQEGTYKLTILNGNKDYKTETTLNMSHDAFDALVEEAMRAMIIKRNLNDYWLSVSEDEKYREGIKKAEKDLKRIFDKISISLKEMKKNI